MKTNLFPFINPIQFIPHNYMYILIIVFQIETFFLEFIINLGVGLTFLRYGVYTNNTLNTVQNINYLWFHNIQFSMQNK